MKIRFAMVLGALVALAGCSAPAHETGPISTRALSSSSVARAVTESAPPSVVGLVTTPAMTESVAAIDGVALFACTGDGWTQLFQWYGDSGPFTGTLTTASLAGDPPDERIESHVLKLTGVIDGESMSITVEGQAQVFGSITTDAISLQVQGRDGSLDALDCESTDPGGWNATVELLRRTAQHNNADAATQIQQQQTQQRIDEMRATVISSYSRLVQATDRLDDRTALDASLHDLRASLGDVKTAAAAVGRMTACELGDASVAAGDVGVAAGDVEVRGGDVDVQTSDLESAASDAQNAIAAIHDAEEALHQIGSAPEINTASAIRAGEAAVTLTTNAVSAARSEADQAANTADGLSAKADAHAAQLCG